MADISLLAESLRHASTDDALESVCHSISLGNCEGTDVLHRHLASTLLSSIRKNRRTKEQCFKDKVYSRFFCLVKDKFCITFCTVSFLLFLLIYIFL